MFDLLKIAGLFWILSGDSSQEQPTAKPHQVQPRAAAVGKITESNWFNPYKKEPFPSKGQFDERIRQAKGKAGVYIIKENNKIVYVGHSKTQLYKTITRHFHKWEHTSRQVSYDVFSANYKVKIIFTPKSEAKDLECKLILKHNPRDNQEKYSFCDYSEVPF